MAHKAAATLHFAGLNRLRKKRSNAVILSAAKDLALSVFKAMRDSSSLLLLSMTAVYEPIRWFHLRLLTVLPSGEDQKESCAATGYSMHIRRGINRAASFFGSL